MSSKGRIQWGFLLAVLAVVVVFAMWPLHQHADAVTGGGWFSSAPAHSINCGSALAPQTSDGCGTVVGHRRALLLGFGGIAAVLGLLAIELAFGSRSKNSNGGKQVEEAAPPQTQPSLATPEISSDVPSRSQGNWLSSWSPGRLASVGVLLLLSGGGVHNSYVQYAAEHHGASPGLLPALLADVLFLGGLALIAYGIERAVAQRGAGKRLPALGLADETDATIPTANPNPTTAPGTQTTARVKSIGAQIDELHELRARGILTPDELDSKTAALLKRTSYS